MGLVSKCGEVGPTRKSRISGGSAASDPILFDTRTHNIALFTYIPRRLNTAVSASAYVNQYPEATLHELFGITISSAVRLHVDRRERPGLGERSRYSLATLTTTRPQLSSLGDQDFLKWFCYSSLFGTSLNTDKCLG